MVDVSRCIALVEEKYCAETSWKARSGGEMRREWVARWLGRSMSQLPRVNNQSESG